MTGRPAELPPFGAVGRCLKCGREIDPAETMCEVCNRAGMVPPAATQMHGTLFVAIAGSVIGLGVVASLLLGNPGPFVGEAVEVAAPSGGVVVVTVDVHNQGSRDGRARCELAALGPGGSELGRVVAITPEVPAGASITFEAQIPGVGEPPAQVEVRCQ